MRIGSLRQRLDIQVKVIVGSTGPVYEPKEEWVNWRESVPCSVTVKRGQEAYFQTSDAGSGQRYGKDTYLFCTRYDSVKGINSTMRIKHAGLIFDIRTIRPDDEYRREMTIEAEVTDAVIGNAPLTASIEEVINEGWVGEEYSSFTVTASGGTEPYSYTTDSAGLAPGLTLGETDGIVSGTPTAEGTWPISIQVTDAAGSSFSLPDFDIVINPSE